MTLNEGLLTLKGQKSLEKNGALYSERWEGAFERTVPVGQDVDPDKVKASFKNGVLTVRLSKKPEAQRQAKRIAVRSKPASHSGSRSRRPECLRGAVRSTNFLANVAFGNKPRTCGPVEHLTAIILAVAATALFIGLAFVLSRGRGTPFLKLRLEEFPQIQDARPCSAGLTESTVYDGKKKKKKKKKKKTELSVHQNGAALEAMLADIAAATQRIHLDRLRRRLLRSEFSVAGGAARRSEEALAVWVGARSSNLGLLRPGGRVPPGRRDARTGALTALVLGRG